MKRGVIMAALMCGTAFPSGAAYAQTANSNPTDSVEGSESSAPLENGGSSGQQPAAGSYDNVIVVTAQKRSENLQDVPLAISALSGDTLASRAINDVGSLATAVPNLTFGSYGGQARIAIRGIGFDTINPGGEGRVAYHLDGVYISRPAATIGTFFDVERVEVLRGPQGTLYGRNATGGSINVITREPTSDFGGYLRLGYGNYDMITSEGAISGPILDGMRFRVAFNTEDRDGYGNNIITGTDIDDAQHRAVRGSLSFDVGSNITLDLSGDYYNEDDRNYGNHYFGQVNPAVTPSGFLFGGIVPGDPRDIANDFDPKNDRTFWGFSGRLQVDLGDLTLQSITGYRNNEFNLLTDLDATSAALSQFRFFESGEQFSQEVQLSGDIGRVNFVLGGYYFRESVFGGSHIPFDIAIFGAPSFFVQGYRVEGDLDTEALAAFGQIDFELSDQITLTAGVRYGWEEHRISDFIQFDLARPFPPLQAPAPIGTRTDRRSEDSFTPRFAIEYSPRDDVLFYASVSKGFKSGGYNIGDIIDPATGLVNTGFDPETLWSYEAGVRGRFLNGLINISGNIFYYDYTNLQVSKVVNSTVVIENAASSELYGVEAQIVVIPADGFQIEISPTWLHSEYRDFESVNRLIRSIQYP